MKKTVLLIILILIFHICESQIKYIDIDPDTVLVGPPFGTHIEYFMDINDDSIQDYSFMLHWCNTNGVNAKAKSITSYDSSMYSYPADIGDTIPDSLNQSWMSETDLITCHYPLISFGLWYGDYGEKYFPIKLKIDSEVHYGWIRASKTPENLTIKDYAYNLVPNEPIIAGDTLPIPYNINYSFQSNLRIYPNPSTGIFNIYTSMSGQTTLIVNNAFGNMVLYEQFENNNPCIDMTGFNQGIYLVYILNNNLSYFQKIIIMR